MIHHLSIQNYALIRSLELSPANGLNTITGETGAGKSIMLGAVGLLLGNRADTKVLLDEGRKCIIEGTFNVKGYHLEAVFEEEELDYDPECILRREISASGKSRAFVNDTPVRLDTLKKIGHRLIDIHSQHETLLLQRSDFQVMILDTFAGNTNLCRDYQQAYAAYTKAKSTYEYLSASAAEAQKELDYKQFQWEELEAAALDEVDVDYIKSELEIQENAEVIQSALGAVHQGLAGEEVSVPGMLNDMLQSLKPIKALSKKYGDLYERLNSALLELQDISGEVEELADYVEYDPAKAEEFRHQLDGLNKLLFKHNIQDVQGLISLRDQLQAEVKDTINLESRIQEAQKEVEQSLASVKTKGTALHDARVKAVKPLTTELKKLLAELGMANATIDLHIEKGEPTANGLDEIMFMFSANKGIPPQSLKKVASGGEFSRLMFSLKYVIAGKTAFPTIIFDEIDTGISGEVAIKMGGLMKKMARNHQLLCITHLPQMAAQGDKHFYVYKDDSDERTVSRMSELSEDERIHELAQMIGGNTPSPGAVESARELLSASSLQ